MSAAVPYVIILATIVAAVALLRRFLGPSHQAALERQRLEYEVRRAQWHAHQVTYAAMEHLLREARTPPANFVSAVHIDQEPSGQAADPIGSEPWGHP